MESMMLPLFLHLTNHHDWGIWKLLRCEWTWRCWLFYICVSIYRKLVPQPRKITEATGAKYRPLVKCMRNFYRLYAHTPYTCRYCYINSYCTDCWRRITRKNACTFIIEAILNKIHNLQLVECMEAETTDTEGQLCIGVSATFVRNIVFYKVSKSRDWTLQWGRYLGLLF